MESRCSEVLETLKALGDPGNVAGMARFGIRPALACGVPKPALRRLAREIGRDHRLSLDLWASGVHEARALASMIDEPARVTAAQMDAWAADFDNWDICDQCCLNLFWKTASAFDRVEAWGSAESEYVKRAGFVLMASLSVHDRKRGDADFREFLGIIEREAGDGRNFVRKAVNWALRQIGKRNEALRLEAIEVARRLRQAESKSARWVGADAIRELSSEAVRRRLSSRKQGGPASRRPGAAV
jgi:3-methyladenine DNA glycosylase AlkD